MAAFHTRPASFIPTGLALPVQACGAGDRCPSSVVMAREAGVAHIVGVTPYKMLGDEVEYLCKLIGPEHIGVGWLGHDKDNPNNREVTGHLTHTYSGVEVQTRYEHWDNSPGHV
jgi:hypothetical protein